MLNYLVDTRDVRFALYEMLKTDEMTKYPDFNELDKETFDSIIDLAEKISVNIFEPTAQEGDKEGCVWDPATKKVKIPACYKKSIDEYYEAEFMKVTFSREEGGMQLPAVFGAVLGEIMCAANYALTMYPTLTHGTLDLILKYGTDEQKAMYVEKMMNGKWGGTMCLTEPEAGSDVGALKTKAVKQADGSYLITGQKIFISNGDNDYYENNIHAVLARIEGDPPGTKGISLFIVPALKVNPDGSTGGPNDVSCSGIEHKMGIKGSPTCTLNFGDEKKCAGYLLGEQKKGMKIMFQMMNFARMGTALAAQGNASAAYMRAITYAKNRIQGVNVMDMLNPDAKSVTIINHPDVKRMLLWMKSHIEAQRALVYLMYQNLDFERIMESEKAKEANALVELLVPICKAGCSDMGVLLTSEAVQILGGYGYCADYPVEKYMRDSKILAIWEGTNGIQSMDLTMRKILMNQDQYNYSIFKKRVNETIKSAKGIVEGKYTDLVEKGLAKCDEVIEMMKKQLAESKYLHLFACATPLQQAMYMLALAWIHLWSLTVTLPKMREIIGDAKGQDRENLLKKNQEAAFYSGKVLASQFYIGSEFPKYFGKMDTILINETAVIKATPEIFTGAPEE